MSRRRTVTALGLLTIALGACGGSSQSPADQAKSAAPASPARPVRDILKEMDDHFARVREIEEAVIRGDIEAVKVPAKTIAALPQASGLPAESDERVVEMKRSADAVAAAVTVANAATATAAMVAICGTCHADSKVLPKFPTLFPPVMIPGPRSHMRMHQYAADLLYQGLAQPSEDMWKKGAEAMRSSPLSLREFRPDAGVTGEVHAFELRVHEIADRAMKAADRAAKVAIYGEVIGGCSSCHGLHGRVFGPGLPKSSATGN